jgi:FdhD protein
MQRPEWVMADGAVPAKWHEYRHGWREVEAEVIQEGLVTLYVNGVELVTIMCSPREQAELALGFLTNEALIRGLGEVEILYVSQLGCCVDIWLDRSFQKPERMVITTGCGGGVSFGDPSLGVEPLEHDLRIHPKDLVRLFDQLHNPGSLHARARGVHAAGLSDGERLLVTAEDVGRHNTIDKVRGKSLLQDIDPSGLILLATGRISSEMLRKAALMGCPLVASRNSPTSLSVAMAQDWNITLVGYVRRDSMRVYAHPERLGQRAAVDISLAEDERRA